MEPRVGLPPTPRFGGWIEAGRRLTHPRSPSKRLPAVDNVFVHASSVTRSPLPFCVARGWVSLFPASIHPPNEAALSCPRTHGYGLGLV